MILIFILSYTLLIASWLITRKRVLSHLEHLVSIILSGLILIFFFFPSKSLAYVIIFNLIAFMLSLVFIYIGYLREDIKLVNFGFFWFSVFIIAKYFDWFWKLFDRSIFFMVGGIIIVTGGILLERRLRKIRNEFKE